MAKTVNVWSGLLSKKPKKRYFHVIWTSKDVAFNPINGNEFQFQSWRQSKGFFGKTEIEAINESIEA